MQPQIADQYLTEHFLTYLARKDRSVSNLRLRVLSPVPGQLPRE